ncbi:MAG: Twitching mobility protein [Legionellaceae bacterium]
MSSICEFRKNSIEPLARFRVNLFQQFRGISSVIRFISPQIPLLENLNFPKIITNICQIPHGLILITGPTGSGKTTTLAAMINYINHHEYKHIITIEDPIEFLHTSHYSLINQREINQHTINFTTALLAALREDPNIILLGELRDLETMRLALTTAETGHLVLATLHTSSAIKALYRMINVFPAEEKEIIRIQLAETLQAIICQHLIKKKQGGRIAGLEILLCIPAVRNLIRENRINQLYSIIQTNLNLGMQTLDQHLKLLVNQEIITKKTAEALAINKEFLF